jgi:hypothetical protein
MSLATPGITLIGFDWFREKQLSVSVTIILAFFPVNERNTEIFPQAKAYANSRRIHNSEEAERFSRGGRR